MSWHDEHCTCNCDYCNTFDLPCVHCIDRLTDGLPDATGLVLRLLIQYEGFENGEPSGPCARTFANHDVYRFGARIHELRHSYGFTINKVVCRRHHHRHVVWGYYIADPKEGNSGELDRDDTASTTT